MALYLGCTALPIRGVYFSVCLPPGPRGGGQKYDLLVGWGKNMIFIKKKRGREEIFTVLGGEKISFWKKGGGGKNIKYLDNIHACYLFK